MNNKDIYSKLTEKIVTMLDEGVVAWQCPWARSTFEAPKNAVTGRGYTGGNFIIMALWGMAKGYSHPLYMTRNQINELNEKISKATQPVRLAIAFSKLPAQLKLDLLRRNAARFCHVKKGEGGYPVIYFEQLSFDDKEGRIDPKTGEIAKVQRPYAQVYWVWNVSQIANLLPSDLPAYAESTANQPELNTFEPLALPETIVSTFAKQMNSLTHEGERAFYRPAADSITVPVQGRFNSIAEYYMTIFHEMIHATGHETRLARDLTGDKMTENYGREELVAEMGAVYLASISGVEVPMNNSAAYLAGWKKACTDDPQIIYWAALRAQAAVEFILDACGINIEIVQQSAESEVA